MSRKNAMGSAATEPIARYDVQKAEWYEPRQSGNVIMWPKGRSRPEILERVSGDRVLERTDDGEPAAMLGGRDDMSVPMSRVTEMKVPLQDEFPLATRAYGNLTKHFRTLLPHIITKKKLEIGPFEHCVSDIVASLERNRDALMFLSKTLAPKTYIHSHSVNVCVLLAAFALDCGKSKYEAISSGLAGLFHDIGMAMLPLSLLTSDRELSPTEQVFVRRHPQLGCELLAGVPGISSEIFSAALEHHERYDGSGYPTGLSASAISFIGHITAIASSYDAITSRRNHKEPVHPHKTLGTMFKLRNRQFHPLLLERFVQMVGIYPVGTVVELSDGYRGIVSATSPGCPTRPVVTIVRDPRGRPMVPQECNMTKEQVSSVKLCIGLAEAGIDEQEAFGILTKKS